MNEIGKTSLTDQTKFRLNEISKIEDYFNQEISQKKLCSKKLSKYVAAFNYIDRVLIVLSATSGGVCIISSENVVRAQEQETKRKSMIKFWCWLKVN